MTISFVPTALAEQLLDLEWPASASLRLLLTGADTLRRFAPATLPFEVINNYGPTEATVVAASGPVLPEPHGASLPPIGKPIASTQIYIADEDGRQVSEGQTGEIYIEGAGVGRGYRNQPDLTAERFVPDIFTNRPGALLYKKGDLGRFLPDGQLMFCGRSDEQIKISGYRVEHGEISAALQAHPAVQFCVVTAQPVSAAERYVAAYVVLNSKEPVSAHELG